MIFKGFNSFNLHLGWGRRRHFAVPVAAPNKQPFMYASLRSTPVFAPLGAHPPGPAMATCKTYDKANVLIAQYLEYI